MIILKARNFFAVAKVIFFIFASSHIALASPVSNCPDFTSLVDKMGQTVVNIRTTTKVLDAQKEQLPPWLDDNSEMSEFFRHFFDVPFSKKPRLQNDSRKFPSDNKDNYSEQNSGVGSGFIFSSDGYVMTNAHVVNTAESIYVTLTDKREFKAKLIGIDERTDIAVVKINASNIPSVRIGDSNKVRVGEWVLAIGSPFGLDNTVTAGIVSAKGRNTGDYLPFIQTDVAVNPGNSGGPLINMNGEVIGINSQIYSRTGGFMGISFAIPIDEAMRVANQLKLTGKVVRGRIGVQATEVTKDLADSLNLTKPHGAIIVKVEPNGPADRAGIQSGDIVLKFNGRSFEKSSDLQRLVGDSRPKTQIIMTIWRKGRTIDFTIPVEEVVSGKVLKQTPKLDSKKHSLASNILGISVIDISKNQLKILQLRAGVQIKEASGSAYKSGLRSGDIILRVGNIDIINAKQFDKVILNLDTRKVIPILVRRGERAQFYLIRPNSSRLKNEKSDE